MKPDTEFLDQMKITLFEPQNLVSIREASKWASEHLKREVSESNIAYLVQYGKIKKHNGGGSTLISLDDLQEYYESYHGQRENKWKERLGNDLNWALSFDHLREKDTTKHVHRLHPYKGKFIPQLVEYFLDDHRDEFKKEVYFKRGDVVLDPFAGSGTTLVQANEMGLHAIGIDISLFNCSISEAKLYEYDLVSLEKEIIEITNAIVGYEAESSVAEFDNELLSRLAQFNTQHFPSPQFKYEIENGRIDEGKCADEREKEFLKIYNGLVKKYKIELENKSGKTFLDKWYVKSVRKEIEFAFEQIKKVQDKEFKTALMIILSRTIRSCRATTHSDLATLKEPQLTTYYCWKHKKICKPLFSIKTWFDRYAEDTIERLSVFADLRTSSHYAVIMGDSRTVDIFAGVEKKDEKLRNILKRKKIKGIFSSPPYVGQIDYHEQHAYAYDLFGFKRKDELEIGPLCKGQGPDARKSYVEGISAVLTNCKQYLTKDFNVLLVANDKFNLYPSIAEQAGLRIVNQFKRPVLNRTERDKAPYSEIIFHLRGK